MRFSFILSGALWIGLQSSMSILLRFIGFFSCFFGGLNCNKSIWFLYILLICDYCLITVFLLCCQFPKYLGVGKVPKFIIWFCNFCKSFDPWWIIILSLFWHYPLLKSWFFMHIFGFIYWKGPSSYFVFLWLNNDLLINFTLTIAFYCRGSWWDLQEMLEEIFY